LTEPRPLSVRQRMGTHTMGRDMSIHLSLAPVISLVAGILILIMPRLLNYIVAVYLILIGILGLI
jgi:hypothetical protein